MINENSPIISFKNYSFSVSCTRKPTLKGINLDIYPGERVLIAGPSGCGKEYIGRMYQRVKSIFRIQENVRVHWR